MEIFNAASKQMDVAINKTAIKQADTSNIAKKPEASAQAEVVEQADTQVQTAAEKNHQDKKEIEEQLKETVKNLNEQMDSLNTNITFGYNDKLSYMYVDVTEKNTGRLIRKFPTEEAMRLSEHFKEIIGMLFDEKG